MRIERALAVIALGVASPALALDVSGTLQRPAEESSNESGRDFYWEEWNGFLATRPARFEFAREVAVVLTGTGAGPAPETPIKLSGGSLMPATIVVRPNAVLRIENQDDFSHEIGAERLSGFGFEGLAPRQTRAVRVTATSAANYAIRDARVPHVRGHIHVVPDLLAVATINAEGRYTFTGVTPGTYTLKVFHQGREVVSRPLVVATTAAVTLDPISLATEAAR